MTTVGEQFARALAAKDFDRVAELLHPGDDFRGMTPPGGSGRPPAPSR